MWMKIWSRKRYLNLLIFKNYVDIFLSSLFHINWGIFLLTQQYLGMNRWKCSHICLDLLMKVSQCHRDTSPLCSSFKHLPSCSKLKLSSNKWLKCFQLVERMGSMCHSPLSRRRKNWQYFFQVILIKRRVLGDLHSVGKRIHTGHWEHQLCDSLHIWGP